jgi:uncharacterized protein YdiU (UPF0061 family)
MEQAVPPISRASAQDLCERVFGSRFVDALPGDADARNVPRPVPGVCYSLVTPTPVAQPRLLGWSDLLGAELGIARPAAAGAAAGAAAVEVLAGNRLVNGMRPYAARYGGHQFGHWAGQLGDGRAITLGELLPDDAPGGGWELQLKGSGPTPYSRHADGRAVLRSSLREFLCSEAMHALGVPTSRALSLVATGEPVVRDMFYDGNPRPEPGAIVCRAAPSFVRFGNFEIHAALGEDEPLRRLAGHVLERHYPDCGPAGRDAWVAMFREVCGRTAMMVAHWMRVGFVHGVMNTDNMSILGLTIDYGPYGWLEGYDPQWTPNTTDAQGRRYCYGNQPQIALWNLARLGGALLPLVGDREPLQDGLEHFRERFEATHRSMLAEKLGLEALGREGDDALLDDLFGLLAAAETDFTLFFRGLAQVPLEGTAVAQLEPLRDAFYDPRALDGAHAQSWLDWLQRWARRVRDEVAGTGNHGDAAAHAEARRIARMNLANPLFVPRNYLAQLAIDAAEAGDASVLERLLDTLRRPYDLQPGRADLSAKRPEWARHRAGCSALSCSS